MFSVVWNGVLTHEDCSISGFMFYSVNHLDRPLRRQKYTSTGTKGHGYAIHVKVSRFQSILIVSVF